MNSNDAELTWPCCAQMSGSSASGQKFIEATTSLPILSGHFTAVKNATPAPSE